MSNKHPKQVAETKYLNPIAEYLPIEKIANGIIYTKDHRYVKIVEVIPINFMLRSPREQRSIIYSFISYLKISPVKVQFKVLTKRADINRHVEMIHREMERETDEHCKMLQEDYLDLIDRLGSREATTRRYLSMNKLVLAEATRKPKRLLPCKRQQEPLLIISSNAEMKFSCRTMRMNF